MHKAIKPIEVSAEAAFRNIETLTLLLMFLPPPTSRGQMTTLGQWGSFYATSFMSFTEKREVKYNLLPESFQEHFDKIQMERSEMAHAKFLSKS